MKWNEIFVSFLFFYIINYLMKHIVNSLTYKIKGNNFLSESTRWAHYKKKNTNE